MKLFLLLLCYTLFPSSLFAQSKIPELTDKSVQLINSWGDEAHIQAVFLHNRETVLKILAQNSNLTKKELRKRLKDTSRPMTSKLLYAGILASFNDSSGQKFLLQRGRTIDKLEDVKDLFWIMGHLDWFKSEKKKSTSKLNMKWAENFMVKMLSEPYAFQVANPRASFDRRSLAMDWFVGNFGNILGEMKSQKLYPILVKLWNDVPHGMDSRAILSSFKALEDKRAIPILMEALKARKNDEYRYASYALAKMNVQEAIPILLSNLNNYNTYNALSSYKDERILPALQKALPNIKEEYALGAAKMLIIKLSSKDKLPQLIALAKDPKHESMLDPMDVILDLKDKRSIPFAIDQLNSSPDLHTKLRAICILEIFPNSKVARKALINAFAIDFQQFAKGKSTATNNNKRFRRRIAQALESMTGHSFGEDKEKWLEYTQNNSSQ